MFNPSNISPPPLFHPTPVDLLDSWKRWNLFILYCIILYYIMIHYIHVMFNWIKRTRLFGARQLRCNAQRAVFPIARLLLVCGLFKSTTSGFPVDSHIVRLNKGSHTGLYNITLHYITGSIRETTRTIRRRRRFLVLPGLSLEARYQSSRTAGGPARWITTILQWASRLASVQGTPPPPQMQAVLMMNPANGIQLDVSTEKVSQSSS